MSLPTGKLVVVHVAVAVCVCADHVTALELQPVFPLQLTVPVTSSGFTLFPLRLTRLYSALIVAVNVTDCPYVDGLPLELTLVLEVA